MDVVEVTMHNIIAGKQLYSRVNIIYCYFNLVYQNRGTRIIAIKTHSNNRLNNNTPSFKKFKVTKIKLELRINQTRYIICNLEYVKCNLNYVYS